MEITALQIAERFIGTKEVKGQVDNPMILSMLKLDNNWPEHDEVPWCSAFVNYIAWLLRLTRSKSLAARSWLKVGDLVLNHAAEPGFDIAVLSRGDNPAAGHVGFFVSYVNDSIKLLGGNQGDTVSVIDFPFDRLIEFRRLKQTVFE